MSRPCLSITDTWNDRSTTRFSRSRTMSMNPGWPTSQLARRSRRNSDSRRMLDFEYAPNAWACAWVRSAASCSKRSRSLTS
ncbi:hypothetical protein D9M72_345940 [compost metagenome]